MWRVGEVLAKLLLRYVKCREIAEFVQGRERIIKGTTCVVCLSTSDSGVRGRTAVSL